jgi:hypothetical protein
MIKFGFDSSSIAEVAQLLETLLEIRFAVHESSFRGGDYYRAEVPQGTVIVQKNYDSIDREPFEHAWPSEKVILYLDGVDCRRWESMIDSIQNANEQVSATRLD